MEQNDLIQKVHEGLAPLLEGTDMFVTTVRVTPTNNIKLFLDADSGMGIDKCALVNRGLYHFLDESDLFPEGDFSLEVSSPGVDEPLQNLRQYQKNVGRTALVTVSGEAEITGKIITATDKSLTLEVKEGKKATVKEQVIPMAEIKSAVIQVSFK